MAFTKRVTLTQPVLFGGNKRIVTNGLVSWWAIDPIAGMLDDLMDADEPTNNGAIYADGWMQGDASATYITATKPTETTGMTLMVYYDPTVSAKYISNTYATHQLFGGNGCALKFTSNLAAITTVVVAYYYTGVGYQALSYILRHTLWDNFLLMLRETS